MLFCLFKPRVNKIWFDLKCSVRREIVQRNYLENRGSTDIFRTLIVPYIYVWTQQESSTYSYARGNAPGHESELKGRSHISSYPRVCCSALSVVVTSTRGSTELCSPLAVYQKWQTISQSREVTCWWMIGRNEVKLPRILWLKLCNCVFYWIMSQLLGEYSDCLMLRVL